MSLDFATFDISELTVLDATDAMGLPEMGASIIIETAAYTPELDDMLGDIGAQAISSSSSSSSCCC